MQVTTNGILIENVTNLPDFLNTIKKVEKSLKSINKNDFIIYRGQSVNKDLFPKLGRPEYDFPKRIDFEKKIIADFRRLSYPHLKINEFNDWDVLAIAQHHFLPTRLLDWTANPLIALWFAVFNQPKEKPNRVVWCYSFKQTEIIDSETGNPFLQKRTLVYQPKHISNRIVSQNGWFTSHFYSEKSNKYTALNLRPGSQVKLRKIKFNIDEKIDRKSILSELDTYGINSYSVFNDLEGLCQYLDWRTYKK